MDVVNGSGGTFRTLHGRLEPLGGKIVDRLPVVASTAEQSLWTACIFEWTRQWLREDMCAQ
jgi:hypothetical protein